MRGRFAPSPTADLHVGNARTALLAWLQARSQDGAFVMRVEDLDRARVVKGAQALQLQGLRELGLDWDEGPDVGGPFGPYVQSERTERYEAAIAQLRTQGRVYECYCSRAEVARAAGAPHGPGDDGPPYPGTCRELTEAERAGRRKTRPASLRFRVGPGTMAGVDGLLGPFTQDVAREVGDFVIRRADGVHAYQLAVVVDDLAMGITHVLRGEDLLHSWPRQKQLAEALGGAAPEPWHTPLVLGPDGERLSKRSGPVTLGALRERGVAPERIVALLAKSLGQEPRPGLARAQLAGFRLDRVPRTPVRFDPAELLG